MTWSLNLSHHCPLVCVLHPANHTKAEPLPLWILRDTERDLDFLRDKQRFYRSIIPNEYIVMWNVWAKKLNIKPMFVQIAGHKPPKSKWQHVAKKQLKQLSSVFYLIFICFHYTQSSLAILLWPHSTTKLFHPQNCHSLGFWTTLCTLCVLRIMKISGDQHFLK